jgi:hypothetical protein
MRRIIILAVSLAAVLVPTAASARTPVSGGFKRTIVTAAIRGEDQPDYQVQVSPEQMRACFDVYTDGSYAYVVGGANFRRHKSRYHEGGLCDIKAYSSGQLQDWQPDFAILHYEDRDWTMLVQFDLITAGELRSHGVPVSVYENLDGGYKPFPGKGAT